MRISAKVDYAVRAAIELAAAADGDHLTKADAIARAQEIPPKFLENILGDLRQGGLVRSQRGAEGGYRLARPAAEITLADIIRGGRPEDVRYAGSAEPLQRLWIAVRSALRQVAEQVTLADLASGKLPAQVEALTRDPDAWVTH
jgi:Rrf2 family protein